MKPPSSTVCAITEGRKKCLHGMILIFRSSEFCGAVAVADVGMVEFVACGSFSFRFNVHTEVLS